MTVEKKTRATDPEFLLETLQTVYVRCVKDRLSKGIEKFDFARRDYEQYKQVGEPCAKTFHNRFGSWQKALILSGVELNVYQKAKPIMKGYEHYDDE